MNTFYSEEELKNLGLKGYGKNVLISRNALLYNPEKLEVGNNVRIDDFTTISGNVTIGDYVHIAQFCGLYGGEAGITMKDFSGLSSRVVIYATSNDYSGNSLTNPTVPEKYKPTDKNMPVVLGKHVIVGCVSKIIGCSGMGRLLGFDWKDSYRIGLGMMVRGEVALIVAQKGLSVGMVDSKYFAPVILLIIVSSMIVPVLLGKAFKE